MLEQAETSSKVALATSLWEIFLILAFKKVLFSVWVLILTL